MQNRNEALPLRKFLSDGYSSVSRLIGTSTSDYIDHLVFFLVKFTKDTHDTKSKVFQKEVGVLLNQFLQQGGVYGNDAGSSVTRSFVSSLNVACLLHQSQAQGVVLRGLLVTNGFNDIKTILANPNRELSFMQTTITMCLRTHEGYIPHTYAFVELFAGLSDAEIGMTEDTLTDWVVSICTTDDIFILAQVMRRGADVLDTEGMIRVNLFCIAIKMIAPQCVTYWLNNDNTLDDSLGSYVKTLTLKDAIEESQIFHDDISDAIETACMHTISLREFGKSDDIVRIYHMLMATMPDLRHGSHLVAVLTSNTKYSAIVKTVARLPLDRFAIENKVSSGFLLAIFFASIGDVTYLVETIQHFSLRYHTHEKLGNILCKSVINNYATLKEVMALQFSQWDYKEVLETIITRIQNSKFAEQGPHEAAFRDLLRYNRYAQELVKPGTDITHIVTMISRSAIATYELLSFSGYNYNDITSSNEAVVFAHAELISRRKHVISIFELLVKEHVSREDAMNEIKHWARDLLVDGIAETMYGTLTDDQRLQRSLEYLSHVVEQDNSRSSSQSPPGDPGPKSPPEPLQPKSPPHYPQPTSQPKSQSQSQPTSQSPSELQTQLESVANHESRVIIYQNNYLNMVQNVNDNSNPSQKSTSADSGVITRKPTSKRSSKRIGKSIKENKSIGKIKIKNKTKTTSKSKSKSKRKSKTQTQTQTQTKPKDENARYIENEPYGMIILRRDNVNNKKRVREEEESALVVTDTSNMELRRLLDAQSRKSRRKDPPAVLVDLKSTQEGFIEGDSEQGSVYIMEADQVHTIQPYAAIVLYRNTRTSTTRRPTRKNRARLLNVETPSSQATKMELGVESGEVVIYTHDKHKHKHTPHLNENDLVSAAFVPIERNVSRKEEYDASLSDGTIVIYQPHTLRSRNKKRSRSQSSDDRITKLQREENQTSGLIVHQKSPKQSNVLDLPDYESEEEDIDTPKEIAVERELSAAEIIAEEPLQDSYLFRDTADEGSVRDSELRVDPSNVPIPDDNYEDFASDTQRSDDIFLDSESDSESLQEVESENIKEAEIEATEVPLPDSDEESLPVAIESENIEEVDIEAIDVPLPDSDEESLPVAIESESESDSELLQQAIDSETESLPENIEEVDIEAIDVPLPDSDEESLSEVESETAVLSENFEADIEANGVPPLPDSDDESLPEAIESESESDSELLQQAIDSENIEEAEIEATEVPLPDSDEESLPEAIESESDSDSELLQQAIDSENIEEVDIEATEVPLPESDTDSQAEAIALHIESSDVALPDSDSDSDSEFEFDAQFPPFFEDSERENDAVLNKRTHDQDSKNRVSSNKVQGIAKRLRLRDRDVTDLEVQFEPFEQTLEDNNALNGTALSEHVIYEDPSVQVSIEPKPTPPNIEERVAARLSTPAWANMLDSIRHIPKQLPKRKTSVDYDSDEQPEHKRMREKAKRR